MLEKEKAAWQAFKDKKPDDFKKIVSANVVAVYAEGMSDMQGELAAMQKWDMKSFAISDYKVTSDGSDTAVTTYKVTVEGTLDGKDQSGTYNAASVWKKQKGRMAGDLSHEHQGSNGRETGGIDSRQQFSSRQRHRPIRARAPIRDR